jgi:hypothetical protein
MFNILLICAGILEYILLGINFHVGIIFHSAMLDTNILNEVFKNRAISRIHTLEAFLSWSHLSMPRSIFTRSKSPKLFLPPSWP